MANRKEIKKILLVNDDIEFVKTIARHLRREGFCIDFEFDHEDAYKKIMTSHHKRSSFQLLITDVLTTIKKGLTLIRKIKQEFPETSILVLSGFGDVEVIRNEIRPEMDDYGPKAITPQEMLLRIDHINSLRKAGGATNILSFPRKGHNQGADEKYSDDHE